MATERPQPSRVRSNLVRAPEDRPAPAAPMAVVDIGSNSIRLVIFDRVGNALVPILNQRVFCALGRGLDTGDSIEPEAMREAVRTVARFARLIEEFGVEEPEYIATAAVRDACNGARLVRDIEEACGARVRILDGLEEARLAALGVSAGMPGATGVMGDLGGGSLELVELVEGRIGERITLPLGTMRMESRYREAREEALRQLRDAIAGVEWLGAGPREHFYPVGGTWRALARLHMARHAHPLHIIHDYALAPGRLAKFARSVSRRPPSAFDEVADLDRRRARHLPYASALLVELLEAIRPRRVRFCSTGVREGAVYARLPEPERAGDALLAATDSLGRSEARSPGFADALREWVEPLVDRSERRRRLARAACHLSDIAWREHPDYRAEQGLMRAARHHYLAASHYERAFLGLAVFHRYGGDDSKCPEAQRLAALLGQGGLRRARLLGRAMRLAWRLSGGSANLLRHTRLRYRAKAGRLELHLGGEAASAPAEKGVERDLAALAEILGASAWEIHPPAD